ncbi:ABC transporter substrate-binding protein [Paenibacillus sp. SYP-B4298]|uniref:ABC transporter substrate-binding protein n=1 Tax=Paenibacillus sp. SYP-B4298 TaxID=2996034 RepID=UPI0022DDC9E8|nr:ABC transporter substrate-binding protein [Paenibacillus sp. SYP-B4298]
MKRRMATLLPLLLVISMLTAACGSSNGDSAGTEGSGSLTLYYSHAADWSDPIVKEFQEKTGITVNLVGAGTGELVARIRAEQANPLGDVLWGGFVDGYAVVDDLLEPYESTELASLIPEAKSPNHTWYGFNLEPMVIVYNPKLVKDEDAPRSWEDLTDPKWKGKIAHADPVKSGSSFTAVVNMILSKPTREEGMELIKRFVDNLDGKLISSSSGTFKGVSDGEYSVGVTYEQGALKYLESGADLKIVYPSDGNTLLTSGLAIVKNAKNMENAQKFVDFLLSKETQSQIGGIYRRTVRTDVSEPEGMAPLDQLNKIPYDMEWVIANKEMITKKWKEFVVGQ